MRVLLYLEDEIPLFGSGRRIIDVVNIGRKWVKLKSGHHTKTIRLSLWKMLEPYAEVLEG